MAGHTPVWHAAGCVHHFYYSMMETPSGAWPEGSPKTPRKHLGNTSETPWKHLRNTPETPQKQPGNTPETPRKHPGYTPETPRKHPGNTPETPRKHPGDTSETPRRHTRDTPEIHRGRTRRHIGDTLVKCALRCSPGRLQNALPGGAQECCLGGCTLYRKCDHWGPAWRLLLEVVPGGCSWRLFLEVVGGFGVVEARVSVGVRVVSVPFEARVPVCFASFCGISMLRASSITSCHAAGVRMRCLFKLRFLLDAAIRHAAAAIAGRKAAETTKEAPPAPRPSRRFGGYCAVHPLGFAGVGRVTAMLNAARHEGARGQLGAPGSHLRHLDPRGGSIPGGRPASN